MGSGTSTAPAVQRQGRQNKRLHTRARACASVSAPMRVSVCVFLCMRILHTRVSACVVFARAPSFALFPLLHMMGEDEDTAHLPASQTTSQS